MHGTSLGLSAARENEAAVEVSIVIPCFNQGHYLGRALESVLRQTFQNWEAIVVDDGSNDDSAQVAQALGDPRIRYHFQENRGLAGARNSGIHRARGRYLAFLDADDEWEPGFLSRSSTALEQVPEAPGVYTGSWFIDEEGRKLPQNSGDYSAVPDFRLRLLEGGFFPSHAAMVRCEALKTSGLFDTTLQGRGVEDWDLWLRLSQCGNMVGIAERLALYRVYAGSMSTDAARMQANRKAVLAKHFGPSTGEVHEWPDEKRYAYGFAHRAAALAYLEQGEPERCWQEMDSAVGYWPAILQRLDTYYELGCGRQPKGYRGQPEPAEIQANGAMIVNWLDVLIHQNQIDEPRLASRAYGQAYLALGILAEHAGDWHLARSYLFLAIKNDWSLTKNSKFVRRLVKLHVGRWVRDMLRGQAPVTSTKTS